VARRWALGIGVAAAIAVGLLVWVRPERGLVPQRQHSEVLPALSAEPVTPPLSTDHRAPTVTELERVGVEDAPRENWNERYLATDDYFAFIAAAAPAAIGGDARAQYLISRALLKCQIQMGVEKELPYALGDARRVCERFHTAHPLDAFDLPPEAKSFIYWRDEALANGDALAAVADATRLLGLSEAARDPATKEQLRRKALAGIRVAVESRDPEAIMTISSFVQRPPTTREPWRSASWLVAACELGLDCSKPPPALARDCATSQLCAGINTVADMLQTVPYPGDVYTAGQDIAYKIKIGDWEGLQQHLALWD
jgi:hypothetical protein